MYVSFHSVVWYQWASGGSTFQYDIFHTGELLVVLCFGARLAACLAFQV